MHRSRVSRRDTTLPLFFFFPNRVLSSFDFFARFAFARSSLRIIHLQTLSRRLFLRFAFRCAKILTSNRSFWCGIFTKKQNVSRFCQRRETTKNDFANTPRTYTCLCAFVRRVHILYQQYCITACSASVSIYVSLRSTVICLLQIMSLL